MFKKLFLFLCFICALFMQINYGNATGIDEINDSNVADFIKARKEAIDKIYGKGKDFFSYDNLNNCVGDTIVNVKAYKEYIDETNKTLSDDNKDELEKLISKEETLRSYCRQNLSIITGVNDGSGFSSNGMLRGMCFFLSILRGNYAKTVAALFVIGLGFLMLFGNLKFTSYLFFVIALALTFGADQLANVISGNKFSCNYINTNYKTAGEIQCPTGSYYKNGRCAFTSCSNLTNTYLDTNFGSKSTSVNNGTKVYRECGIGKYGYIEYICKDGELDYNSDTCYTPGNYCTAEALPVISGANFNLSGMTIEVGTIVESTCADGYVEGKAKIVCQRDKSWKIENTCKVDASKYCNTSNIYEDLGGSNKINSKHIKLNISKVKQEQVINPGKTDIDIGISCDIGYEGNVSILCGTNKKWSINGKCTIIKCPTGYNLNNGKYTITNENNTYKSEITGVCNTGYVGTPKIICGLDGNWSVLSGSCTLDKSFCSTLSVKNGAVDNKRTVGSYATLKCNNGYDLSGKKALLCTKNGTWDGEFGTCELSLNYCNKIDSIVGVDKIEYIDGNRALGSRMKITCKDGYMLKGNNILKCQSDKTWNLTSGTCERISCSNLAPAENVSEWYGNIATKDQEIQGVCKKGYTGKPKAKCNGDGKWEITNNCAVDMHYCGSLSVANGNVEYSNEQATGSKATLTCDTGYELSGKSSVNCEADKDGLWSDKIGNCPKVRCPTSLTLSNGKYTITSDNNKFGDKVAGICNSGYVGEPIATCNADKTWSTTGSCELVECNGLDKINPHSEYKGVTTTKYGKPVEGTCEIGYKGNPIASCQADGTWSVKDDCKLDTEFCSEINAMRGAYIAYKGNGRALGSKAILTCGTGFRLTGNDTVTCNENKKWEASLGSCKLIIDFCTKFSAVENGTIKYTEYQAFDSIATLTCETGYGLKGNGKAVCINNENSSESGKGEWNQDLGVCEAEENWCPEITKEITNGAFSRSKSNNIGSVATLQCDVGYEINGNAEITCGSNQKWNGELGDCKLIENYCPAFGTIENGVINYPENHKFAYDSTITLECKTGYSLSGISSAKCKADKKWTELGTCEIIRCPITTLTVENGTYDEITTENSVYGKIINGRCKNGYKGSPKAICDKDGNWALSGSCGILDCENLTIGSDSTNWSATGTSYGKSIYGTCKTGYITDCIDNSKTDCEYKDRWQPMVRCESVEVNGVSEAKWDLINKCNKIMTFCPELSDEHGEYSYSEKQALDSTATLTCKTGYELIDNLNTTVCQEDKTWNKSIKCKIKVCENLQKQPEEHIASWATTKADWNTTVNGTCEDEYIGLPTATCLDNKTWDIKGKCALKTCSDPIKQGHITSWDEAKANINETITGKCEIGYKGIPTAKCIDQDKWEYDDNCEIMTCNDPELIGNIKSWSSTTTTYGTPIYGTCIEGYEGKPEANCNAEEKWEIIDSCKPKVCSNLEKQEGIASWSDTTASYNQEEQITGVCAKGYAGTATATCKADQTWEIKNNCKKIKNYCPEITRSGTITYTDGQTIGSVAKLTCQGKYTVDGAEEVKCITDDTDKNVDKGKWDKELGDCGVVIQFYSPRNDVVKEKVFKKGETFYCKIADFGGVDPDSISMILCKIKGSDKYFDYQNDITIHTVNDALFTKQSSACHIAYADKDLSTDKLRKNYKAGGETKLYNNEDVYSSDYGYGLRKDSEKYMINCSSGYAGKPEIVCDNGTWTWNPKENTDNQCYEGGCDINDIPVAGRNINGDRYGLDPRIYSESQRIARNDDWVAAYCKSGYVSNQDTSSPKQLSAVCRNGQFIRTIGGVTYGDECVPGCVYGDKENGWTDEMMKGTTGNYAQHDTTNNWGKASVGKYAIRIDTKVNKGALLYKNCASGYSVDNSSQAVAVTYPMVQCNTEGKWTQHGGYKVGCVRPSVDCGAGTLTGDVTNGYCTYNYTGEMQTFKSTGIKKVFLKVWGAQGGGTSVISYMSAGKGGYSHGFLTLDSGTTDLYVYVGGQGQTTTTTGGLGAGGWNGGGNCYGSKHRLLGDNYYCGGGGGATDIRKSGTEPTDRIIVAGGGGGGVVQIKGGYGGGGKEDYYAKGGKGDSNAQSSIVDFKVATGGTLTSPGAGALIEKDNLCSDSKSGNDGKDSNGGDANNVDATALSSNCYNGGGGGGGYYGGGSGAISYVSTSGGGGSGYVDGVSNGGGYYGLKSGDGLARICWGSYTSELACPGI